jgi:hypothetical protein
LVDALDGNQGSRSAEPLSLRSGTLQARQDTLPDALSLELGQRSQNVELELPGWRRAVDAFPEADEGNPKGIQIFDQDNEVPEIPAKAIQSPADHHVKPSTPRIGHELIEGGTSILRPAHPSIDVLDCGPGPSLDVPPKFLQLVLGLLVERRDPGVDRRPHAAASADTLPAFRI